MGLLLQIAAAVSNEPTLQKGDPVATVAELLGVKGNHVYTVRSTATVFTAISEMVSNNVGALVVVDDSGPSGMFTERDYLRRVALEGRSSRTTFVTEIMSHGLIYVRPASDVAVCLPLMTHRRIRHLPVLDQGELSGLISIGDVVKQIAREREVTIKKLTSYIQYGYL